MNVVIYARYSSHSQTEQSIEGQLKACYDYAKQNNMSVIAEYIDRAQSGTNDNRANFQKMIADSDRGQFQGVLVYQLDRFARNRYDSATYKAKLKKNGVRVFSARENINDDASGVLMEAVLEGMAEYYSVELSQKIRRGMDINAAKCLSTGSNPGLGFKVDADKHIIIDEDNAPFVRQIFEWYAAGKTVAEIVTYANERQIKTSRGGVFNKNSLHALLRNKRYIGTYTYKGTETPDAIPRIVDDETFEAVQTRLNRNKKAPARARAKEEYLLTTKLFCGYCHEMMTGYGGTSKTGRVHHYYICNGRKRKLCHKKNAKKDFIEDYVVNKCRELLTDENIALITREVLAICAADKEDTTLKQLKKALNEVTSSIDNLLKALEQGQATNIILSRLQERTNEKQSLEAKIAVEQLREGVEVTADDVRSFLLALKRGDKNDLKYRRMLVTVFVDAVYLYDDKITIILNTGNQAVTITEDLLGEIEENNSFFASSFMNSSAPPHLHGDFDTITVQIFCA
jgi:DNA invertase Pin-like site-specific DNA recombinase